MAEDLRIRVNGKTFDVAVLERTHSSVRFSCGGRTFFVDFEKSTALPGSITAAGSAAAGHGTHSHHSHQAHRKRHSSGLIEVRAPMPGVITTVLAAAGAAVLQGAPLLRIEAMKMENTIFCPLSATIKSIDTEAGAEVGDGQLLLTLLPK